MFAPAPKPGLTFETWASAQPHFRPLSDSFSLLSLSFQKHKLFSIKLTLLVFPLLLLISASFHLFAVFSLIPALVGAFSVAVVEHYTLKYLLKSTPKIVYHGISEHSGLKHAMRLSARTGITTGLLITCINLSKFAVMIWASNSHFLPAEYSRETYSQMFQYFAGFIGGSAIVSAISRTSGSVFTQACEIAESLQTRGEAENERKTRGKLLVAETGTAGDLSLAYSCGISACMFLTSVSPQLIQSPSSMYFPLLLHALSIPTTSLCSLCFFSEYFLNKSENLKLYLKFYLISCTCLTIGLCYWVLPLSLPEDFQFLAPDSDIRLIPSASAFLCITIGVLCPALNGLISDLLPSPRQVRGILDSYSTGAATGLISGLAHGYFSCITTSVLLTLALSACFSLADIYGICLAALGCVLCTPVYSVLFVTAELGNHSCRMVGSLGLSSGAERKIRKLEEVSASARRIFKGAETVQGFLVGLACCVALWRYAGRERVDIMQPLHFAAIFVGGMVPFALCAQAARSAMRLSVRISEEIRGRRESAEASLETWVDYEKCSEGAGKEAVRGMWAFLCLVFGGFWAFGIVFGASALVAMSAGVFLAGVYLATAGANSGIIWRSSVYYIESLGNCGKGTRDAAAVTDIVGRALREILEPAVVNFIKAISAFTFAFIYSRR